MKERVKEFINKGNIKGLYQLAAEDPVSFFSKISHRQIGKTSMEKLYLLLKHHKGVGYSFEEILFQQVQRQVIGGQLKLM